MIALSIKKILKSKSLHLIKLGNKFVSAELSNFIIDLEQLKLNWRWLDTLTHPNCITAGVVKANAYGHGLGSIATSLFEAGCRIFCVARLEEALELRNILVKQNISKHITEIVTFDGLQKSDIDFYHSHKITPALKKVSEIEVAANFANISGIKFPVWIQLDTGMNRLGISETELNSSLKKMTISNLSQLDISVIMSHLSSSDTPSHEANERQRVRFEQMSKRIASLPLSLAASHGMFLSKEFHYDITRPGIALYGYQDSTNANFNCKPILDWMAPILQIRDIRKGEQIGYGADFTANRSMRIAAIGAGYADGYRRSLAEFGKVDVGGFICTLVGRISMDSLVIDVSNVPEAVLGRESQACLIGKHYNAKDMATDLSTITYEILTNLGSRPQRIYEKN